MSVNKVILIGNLGNDPEVRSMQSGDKVANLSIATSESWKDKTSGERKSKTEWHKVSVFNQGLIKVCESYLKKGSKVYIEGQIETRKWQDQAGQDKYTTEIVLRPYGSTLTMLDSRNTDENGSGYQNAASGGAQEQGRQANNAPDLDDEIPF